MTALQFPERPDLAQLKRQAKELLAAARRLESSALLRFRLLPAYAHLSDAALGEVPLALHDAQSVIARELGFPSWNALRARVEELTVDQDAMVARFVEAATEGRRTRAARLLAAHSAIASANLWTALITGDAAGVEARLAGRRALATEPGGPRGWEPLLYVCHSAVGEPAPPAGSRATLTDASRTASGRGSSSRDDGLAAVARLLVQFGADPNIRFPWLHHGVRRPVLWGATRVSRSLPLARALLELGADPNDGVTLTLAVSANDLATLELLHEFGADPNHPWATDGAVPLYAVLGWGVHPDDRCLTWLVEHGADPDIVFDPTGETPLHAAARTGSVALVEALVAHGADVARRNHAGRTPYAEAALVNNRPVAEWLRRHGSPVDMAPVDELVAACSRGDRTRARRLIDAHAGLAEQFTDGHYAALYLAAERADTAALESLLDCGFDPNRGDSSMGMTALHKAAMAGQPESVRVLLAHGASVTERDREFHATALIAAAEGARSKGSGGGADYDAVGQLLLDAGSPVEWAPGAEPSEGILAIVDEWRSRFR